MTDSLIANGKTLNPVFYGTFAKNMQSSSVDYSDNEEVQVRIYRTIPGFEADTTFSVRFEELRYDAHWIMPILYGLQIDEGMHLKIPTFLYNLGKTEMEITLVGEEQITLNNKTYNAWKLNIKDSSYREATVWLDKTSQFLLMLSTPAPRQDGFTIWQRYNGE